MPRISALTLAAMLGFAARLATAADPVAHDPATAAHAAFQWPGTPAAVVARDWVETLNSGDPAAVEAFKARRAHAGSSDEMLFWRRETGGVDPVRVESSEPGRLVLLLRQRVTPEQLERATFVVEGERLASLDYQLAPRPDDLRLPRLSADAALAALRGRIDTLSAQDRFAGSVLVAQDGAVVFEHHAGLADRERRVPIDADTRFRLGSLNKMFTAVAVLQLVERGRLRLDDPVGRHLPEYPNAGVAGATVRQLLNHTAGAGDIFGPEWAANRPGLRTHGDYLRLYGARAPTHPPGTKDAYANYGFVLLGVLVERVSGMDYYAYVDRHVFAPAGMTATGSLPESDAVPERSTGYMWRDGTWIPNTETLPWRGTAAGGGYSTPRDLLRFAQALQAGRLLSPAMLAEATRAQNHGGWYGYGFIVRGEGATRAFGHAGGAEGMNADFRVYPALGRVTVALSNLDSPAAHRPMEMFELRMPVDTPAPAATR